MKFILLCALMVAVYAEKARFDNYRVYSLNIVNKEQVDIMYRLENSSEGYLFWNSIDLNRIVDVMVPSHKFADIIELANAYNIEYTLKIENVQT